MKKTAIRVCKYCKGTITPNKPSRNIQGNVHLLCENHLRWAAKCVKSGPELAKHILRMEQREEARRKARQPQARKVEIVTLSPEASNQPPIPSKEALPMNTPAGDTNALLLRLFETVERLQSRVDSVLSEKGKSENEKKPYINGLFDDKR